MALRPLRLLLAARMLQPPGSLPPSKLHLALARWGRPVTWGLALTLVGVQAWNTSNIDNTVAPLRDTRYEPPAGLQERTTELARQLELPNPDNVKVFVKHGTSAVSAGSCLTSAGARIGVPCWFLDQVQHSAGAVAVQGQVVSESRERRIRDMLTPTPEQRDFVIAHELVHIKRHDGLMSTAVQAFLLLAARPLLLFATDRHSMLRVPARFVCLACVPLVMVVNHMQELTADRLAVALGPRFRTGARHTLDKALALNREFEEPDAASWTHPALRTRLAQLDSTA
eukprot:m.32491 g.32491  ORF g.32491 m.32491 type:complete len:284 (-) comp10048_c0_seq1:370-1221(-)